MAKVKFTEFSDSYIFEDAGEMRDTLEQVVLIELEAKQYPLPAKISTIKATGNGLVGALFGTKEQCVVIKVDDEAQVAIASTAVGTYLYVEVYLMIQEKFSLFTGLTAMTDNVFKQQRRKAVYAAAKAATESAFGKLALKQCNSGYKAKGNKSVSDND